MKINPSFQSSDLQIDRNTSFHNTWSENPKQRVAIFKLYAFSGKFYCSKTSIFPLFIIYIHQLPSSNFVVQSITTFNVREFQCPLLNLAWVKIALQQLVMYPINYNRVIRYGLSFPKVFPTGMS